MLSLAEQASNRQSVSLTLAVRWRWQQLGPLTGLRSLSSPDRITWLRVDEDVPPHAVVTGSNLYIENLNKSYNGTYRCVASNTVGEAYDDYILYVHGRCRASTRASPLLQSRFKGKINGAVRRCRRPLQFVWLFLF